MFNFRFRKCGERCSRRYIIIIEHILPHYALVIRALPWGFLHSLFALILSHSMKFLVSSFQDQ
ncbi:hypothetical protein CW304_13630 [Bacillus sp. UFRGS-B20]|nr:hypothetical protein CW304_13630 [Bacillus sp. UFRGS-B20]